MEVARHKIEKKRLLQLGAGVFYFKFESLMAEVINWPLPMPQSRFLESYRRDDASAIVEPGFSTTPSARNMPLVIGRMS